MTVLPDSIAEFVRQLATDHAWHATMQLKPLHPVVANLLANQPLPEHWQAVILGWPRVSDDDAAMLAYAPNEEKALKGIVTTTTPAKYIRKFWVDMADHEVRDVVLRVANEANFRWFTTTDEIVRGVQEGPRSCMQKDYFDTPGNPHPYRAYAPELGWRMAVRLGPEGRIDGRALVYTSGTESVFVRSYQRTFERGYNGDMVESYSQSDAALEAWLWDQGVEKLDGWDDGTKLAKVLDLSERAQVPYLDGCNDRFNFIGDHIVVEDGGRYCADCQDGSYSDEGGDWRTCSCCGDRFDAEEDDDYIYAGFRQDQIVGECCRDAYTNVKGRDGQSYYVHEDGVVTVGGVDYDEDYLAHNDVIELHDGEYAKQSDAVHSAWDDEWYRPSEVVDTQDLGPVPEEYTWRCAASNDCYSDDVRSVEVDGETYHPDHAPDEEEDDPTAPLSEPQAAALDTLLAA